MKPCMWVRISPSLLFIIGGKLKKEIWKDVVGYEEYYMISSYGKVWSKRTNKEIKTTLGKTGYYVFSTRLEGRKSKAICLKVHRLVATAFIENTENKPYVNHKDGIKTNNYADNLEWCTAKENSIHSIEVGLFNPYGEDNNISKLKDKDVIEIVNLMKEGKLKQTEIAKIYKVGKGTIRDIKFGKTWSWLTGIKSK